MSHKSSGRRTPQAIKLVDGELGILLRRICFLHCHLPAHGLGTRRAPKKKTHADDPYFFYDAYCACLQGYPPFYGQSSFSDQSPYRE